MKRRPAPVDWGLLVLRIGPRGSFVVHGSQTLFGAFGGPGLPAFTQMVGRMGLPGPAPLWGTLAAGSEFFGGLAVLLGVLTEFGALAIAAVMIVAIWKVHGKNGYFSSN